MPLESLDAKDLALDDLRWKARVDLAAAHRMAVTHGFHEGIFNHFTLRVPGTTDRYYQIPFGLHWSEVNASCFMEVGYDGEVKAGDTVEFEMRGAPNKDGDFVVEKLARKAKP